MLLHWRRRKRPHGATKGRFTMKAHQKALVNL